MKCGKTWVLASVSCSEGFRMRERTQPNVTVSANLRYITASDASHVALLKPMQSQVSLLHQWQDSLSSKFYELGPEASSDVGWPAQQLMSAKTADIQIADMSVHCRAAIHKCISCHHKPCTVTLSSALSPRLASAISYQPLLDGQSSFLCRQLLHSHCCTQLCRRDPPA